MSGNVWMFSDQIDDEDVEFMTHDFVTYNMACDYYRLGLKTECRIINIRNASTRGNGVEAFAIIGEKAFFYGTISIVCVLLRLYCTKSISPNCIDC